MSAQFIVTSEDRATEIFALASNPFGDSYCSFVAQNVISGHAKIKNVDIQALDNLPEANDEGYCSLLLF